MNVPRSRVALAVLATLALTLMPSVAGSAPRGPEVGAISGVVSNVDRDAPGSTYVTADRVGSRTDGERWYVDEGDGTYEMDNLAPGDYRVRFFDQSGTRAWEWYPGTRDSSKATIFHVEGGQSITHVDASLEPAGHIAGTIRFPYGTDLRASNAFVTAYYLDGSTWRPVPSQAAKQRIRDVQTFTIGGLPTGTYRFKYDSAGGTKGTASGFLGGKDDAATSTPVSVVAGQTRTISMTPRRGGVLRGRVLTPEGRSLAGARVRAFKLSDTGESWNQWYTEVKTNWLGSYQIPWLDTGDYALTILPPAPYQIVWSGGALPDFTRLYPSSPWPPYGTALVHVTAARSTTWRDERAPRAGTLEGTVRDQYGRPVPGMKVGALGGTGYIFADRPSFDLPPLEVTTDANGHYSFGEVPHAAYKLTFSDPSMRYANYTYSTLEYSHGDPLHSFDGTIVMPGRRNVIDIQTWAYPAASAAQAR